MYEITARDFPLWAGEESGRDPYRGRSYRNNLYGRREPGMKAERIVEVEPGTELPPLRTRIRFFDKETFKRRYGVLLIALAFLTSWTLGVYGYAYRKGVKVTTDKLTTEHEQALKDQKEAQQQETAAQYFLSGEASREAFLNQETDAVAGVISKLTTDAQKATEAACMLARVMNPVYPGTFAEVAAQTQQWMFYDGSDKTFSLHDREIAESIVRPYIESGIIPNGLTSDMVYGSWSPNDFVLRDSYETTPTMHTWRYQG